VLLRSAVDSHDAHAGHAAHARDPRVMATVQLPRQRKGVVAELRSVLGRIRGLVMSAVHAPRRAFGGSRMIMGRPATDAPDAPTIPLRRLGNSRFIMVVRGRPNMAWSLGLLCTGAVIAVVWTYAMRAAMARSTNDIVLEDLATDTAETTSATTEAPSDEARVELTQADIELDDEAPAPLNEEPSAPKTHEASSAQPAPAAHASRPAMTTAARSHASSAKKPAPPPQAPAAPPAVAHAANPQKEQAKEQAKEAKHIATADPGVLADEQLKAALR
jgi:hypothetical protein